MKGEGGLRKEKIYPSRGLPQPSAITRIETDGRVVAGKHTMFARRNTRGERSLSWCPEHFPKMAVKMHSLQIATALHGFYGIP